MSEEKNVSLEDLHSDSTIVIQPGAFTGVRRVPVVDRSSGEPKEIGWANVDDDGNVIDSDVTDPEAISKLRDKVMAAYGFADVDREFLGIPKTEDEIPDTFKE